MFPTPPGNSSPYTSHVSYNATQFGHYLTGDSVKSHRLRSQSHKTVPPTHILQTEIASTGCYLWAIRSKVSMTPSLCSINFPEGLTELRERFYLPYYQFIRKGYNSQVEEMRSTGYEERVWGFFVLSRVPLSPNPTCFPKALRALPSWVFMEVFSYKHELSAICE